MSDPSGPARCSGMYFGALYRFATCVEPSGHSRCWPLPSACSSRRRERSGSRRAARRLARARGGGALPRTQEPRGLRLRAPALDPARGDPAPRRDSTASRIIPASGEHIGPRIDPVEEVRRNEERLSSSRESCASPGEPGAAHSSHGRTGLMSHLGTRFRVHRSECRARWSGRFRGASRRKSDVRVT